MPQKTLIEWTDYTSNPIYAVNKETGKRGWFCVKVSPGCGHCYSETLNVGRLGNKLHYAEKNIENVKFVLNEKELVEIIKLNNRLAKKGLTKKMFLMDMSDLFFDAIPNEYIDEIFAVVALCPNIIFQILTKRAERMKDYISTLKNYSSVLSDFWLGDSIENAFGKPIPALHETRIDKPLPNVWLGVSCEDQKTADKRIPFLLETPAKIRFLSCEPLLSEIDLVDPIMSDAAEHPADDEDGIAYFDLMEAAEWDYLGHKYIPKYDADLDQSFCERCGNSIFHPRHNNQPNSQYSDWQYVDWVIANARPCNIDWVRSIVLQCKSAGVKCFVKQMSSGWAKENGCGKGDIDRFPADLRTREFPNGNK